MEVLDLIVSLKDYQDRMYDVQRELGYSYELPLEMDAARVVHEALGADYLVSRAMFRYYDNIGFLATNKILAFPGPAHVFLWPSLQKELDCSVLMVHRSGYDSKRILYIHEHRWTVVARRVVNRLKRILP